MFVCSWEENIQNLDQEHIFEFPNLKRNLLKSTLSKKSHVLKIESKSSRECHLEFFNIETGNVLPLKLKFHHIHDSYKIELDNIFDENHFFFKITNKAHVFISCTRMFQKRTKELIYNRNIDKRIDNKYENGIDNKHENRYENKIDNNDNKINKKNDEKNDNKNMTSSNNINHDSGRRKKECKIGLAFFVLVMEWKYYKTPFSHISKLTSSKSSSISNSNKCVGGGVVRKSFTYQDPVKILVFEFLPIFATFLIDYKPSFHLATCDEWLSHVINSSVRAFNAEYGLSFFDDFNVTEFIDSITPQLYSDDSDDSDTLDNNNTSDGRKVTNKNKYKSDGNNFVCNMLNLNEKDCAYFIREGYLYLLGDDESVPFKPVQELIQKIKFLQQHVKDILIALFLSHYKHGLLVY
jgi:hypothetical protein